MRKIAAPAQLNELARVYEGAGKRCYLVGGAVRDAILGRPVNDFDVATDARPEETLGLFRKVIPTGIKHGTVTVLFKGLSVEVTTFRSESGYSDGRHPDSVTFASSIEEDLSRRDFTMNAMAWDLAARQLADPYHGLADLEAHTVRAVGDPGERFYEDGLRPLRAVRFASQLDFEIENATLAAIAGSLDRFALVSAERVRDEFAKILLSPRPSFGLRLMESTGLLSACAPELASCRGVLQKGMHRFDVLDHLLLSVDAAPRDLELRLAALFHDLGKPGTKVEVPGSEPTFYRHEELSARMAAGLMRRFRFPNALVDAVAHLIACHMFSYDDSWGDAAVRRFLARVGEDEVEKLFALRLADGTGMTGIPVDPRALEPFRRRIATILAAAHAFGLKDLAIGGAELATVGVPKGPVMGMMLQELLDTVLDDPTLNEEGKLLEIASKLKGKYGLE